MKYDTHDPLQFGLMYGRGPALANEKEALNKALECPEDHDALMTVPNRKTRRAKARKKKVVRVETPNYSRDHAYKGSRRVI
jgi:hypothetical protein